MKHKIFTVMITICVVGFSSGLLMADVWSEREALSKVEQELQSIKVLILAAKSQRDPNARTTFNYQVLLSDIDKVRSGISSHLADRMEPIVPSSIDALQTDYTERHQ